MKDLGKEYEMIFLVRKNQIVFASKEHPLAPEIGDIALACLPKPTNEDKAKPVPANA